MTALYISLGVGGGIIVIIAVILLIPRCKVIRYDKADKALLEAFDFGNVLVFGRKRHGKDLIFAHVIAMRGEKHYANIPYDENTEVRPLSDLNVGDNTFKDFINDTVRPFTPNFEEGYDFWISDGGIYLPCHYDKELDNQYPGMPIFFALSSQLYDMNVHLNSQAVERPWKKLKEQADLFIQALRTTPHGEYLYVKTVWYDKLNNAANETNSIAKYIIRIPIAELKYDTRYFREFLFDCPPKTQQYFSKLLGRLSSHERKKSKIKALEKRD